MYIKVPGSPVATHCFTLNPHDPTTESKWYSASVRVLCPLTRRPFPYSRKDEVFQNDVPSLATPTTTYKDFYTWKFTPRNDRKQPMPSKSPDTAVKLSEASGYGVVCWGYGDTRRKAHQYLKDLRCRRVLGKLVPQHKGWPSSQQCQSAKAKHVNVRIREKENVKSPANIFEDLTGGAVNFRSGSATSQSKPLNRPTTCRETAWDTEETTKNDRSHWLSWNTGELPQPGIQTRLHRPYPSPVPPSGYGDKGFVTSKVTRQPTLRKPTPPPPARPASVTSAANFECTDRLKSPAANLKYDIAPHPYFRSWHTSNCNGYEADVTYNMLQHLYGGKARDLDRMRRTKPGRYEHPINFERRIITGTYKGLERMDNSGTSGCSSAAYQRAPMDYYPVSYHAPRSGMGRTDHTASSFFQYTQPAVKSSFVIHPQFLSEHCEFSQRLKSTKNLSHLTAAKGEDGFRYGSGKSGV